MELDAIDIVLSIGGDHTDKDMFVYCNGLGLGSKSRVTSTVGQIARRSTGFALTARVFALRSRDLHLQRPTAFTTRRPSSLVVLLSRSYRPHHFQHRSLLCILNALRTVQLKSYVSTLQRVLFPHSSSCSS